MPFFMLDAIKYLKDEHIQGKAITKDFCNVYDIERFKAKKAHFFTISFHPALRAEVKDTFSK